MILESMHYGNRNRTVWALLLATAIFVVAATALSWGKLAAFRYNAIDLGIYNQVFWNTIHGRPFGLSIHPHLSLGDHFEPVILFLAPLYALVPGPKILIVLQALALGGSALLIFLLAKEILHDDKNKDRWSFGFALAWLVNPFVWNIQLFEWHTLPFAIPPLLAALLFFERKRFLPFVGMLTLALLVREDVALVVAGFGLYGLARRRGWRWSVTPLLLGLAWFLLTQRVIARFAVGGTYKFLVYYGWLGNSFGEIAANIFQKPLAIAAHLATFANVEMVIGLLMPFLFVPVVAPQAFLIILPTLAQFMLGAPGGSSLIFETHYVSLFLPALFTAFIFGVRALPTLPRLGTHLKRHAALLPLLLASATLYSSVMLGPIPGTVQSLQLSKNDPLVSETRRILALIPEEAGVAASYAYLPQLSSRQNLASLHYAFLGLTQFGTAPYALPQNIDYILIDTEDFLIYGLQFTKTFWTREAYTSGSTRLRAMLEERGFGVTETSDSLVLLRRGVSGEIMFARNDEPPKREPQDLGPFEFLGAKTNGNNPLHFDIFLHARESVVENYAIEFSVHAADGSIIYKKLHPLASGLYPTSEWEPGEVVRSRYKLLVPNLPREGTSIEARLVVLDGFLEHASDRGATPRFNIKKSLPAFIISQKTTGDD